MVESHLAHDSGRIFVGRHREMVELTAALNDALTGMAAWSFLLVSRT